MTLVDRRKSQARRRPAPAFDRLEERAMLTTSTVTHVAFAPILAEAARTMAHVVSPVPLHAVNHGHAAVTHQTAHVVTSTHTARASDHSAKFKASPVHLAHQMLLPGGPVSPNDNSPVVGALTPGQIRTAYGINLLPNMGAGTTIGIVDIFNDPSIVGDRAAFSNQ